MEENKKIEVVYEKAAPSKRMLAYIIDVGIFILTAIIFFTFANMGVRSSSFYTQKEKDLATLKIESSLYVDDKVITDYIANNSDYPNYEDKKAFLSNHIDAFYSNLTYFSDVAAQKEAYDKRKLDNPTLFEKNGEDEVVEKAVEPELLYKFYVEEVDNHAMTYLFNNIEYVKLTQFFFLVILVEIIIVVFLSFLIYFYIIPVTFFRRGRQTIGMKLEKIGLISIYAVNQTFWVYTLRALFMFFVFIVVNFVSFLIPTFVSLAMMYFTKRNSSLVNYVFNDYIVNVKDQDIYLDDVERYEAQESLKQLSIRDKDFSLK